jgi:hypothetical protein
VSAYHIRRNAGGKEVGYRCPKRQDRKMISLYLEMRLMLDIQSVARYDRITIQDLGEKLFTCYVSERPFIQNPDLHLEADGKALSPISVKGLHYIFKVPPANTDDVFLASRSVVPSEFSASNDQRRLGVAIERIVSDLGNERIELSYDSDDLTEGFYVAEHDEANRGFRWTNGRGRLPKKLFNSSDYPITIDVYLNPNVLNYKL